MENTPFEHENASVFKPEAGTNSAKDGEATLPEAGLPPAEIGTPPKAAPGGATWWQTITPDLVGYILILTVAVLCLLSAIVLKFMGL